MRMTKSIFAIVAIVFAASASMANPACNHQSKSGMFASTAFKPDVKAKSKSGVSTSVTAQDGTK